jgi:hypothetical protein
MLDQEIFKKEKSLLDFPNRASVKFLEEILVDDFVEVGSVGKKWVKSEIIDRLKVSEPIDYELRNFKISQLSDSVVLSTYDVKLKDTWSFRSSVWIYDNNDWRMKYHQGTKSSG